MKSSAIMLIYIGRRHKLYFVCALLLSLTSPLCADPVVDYAGWQWELVASGVPAPQYLDADTDDNLYTSYGLGTSAERATKILTDGTWVSWGDPVADPDGVSFRPGDGLYVSGSTGTVKVDLFGTTTPFLSHPGFNAVGGCFDSSFDFLYLPASSANDHIMKIDIQSTAVTQIPIPVDSLVFDVESAANSHLFMSYLPSSGTNIIREIQSDGTFLNDFSFPESYALAQGLHWFDDNTLIICFPTEGVVELLDVNSGTWINFAHNILGVSDSVRLSDGAFAISALDEGTIYRFYQDNASAESWLELD